MEIQSIRVDSIIVENRLRSIDEDYVTLLASSIESTGLQTPIAVTRTEYGPELVAGAHRLAAFKKLGRQEIDARIIDGDKDTLRLFEIDENLVRRELSALDRATFLAERKAIYERLYPETAGKKAGAFARWHQSAKLSFASDVAKKLGLSNRDIRRSIFRALNIAPKVRERIAGTSFAEKGTDLDLLARMTSEEQLKIIDLLFDEAHPAKSIPDAIKRLRGEGEEPVAQERNLSLERLLAAWKAANPKAREEFINFLDAHGFV